MKYLAAYALLALSGKKDISTPPLTQPQATLKPCSAAFNPTPPMQRSTKSSRLSRERPSINWLLRDNHVWEAHLHLLRLRRRRLLRRRRRSQSLRRRSPRRRLWMMSKNNKTQILEISSDDTHRHIYLFCSSAIKQYQCNHMNEQGGQDKAERLDLMWLSNYNKINNTSRPCRQLKTFPSSSTKSHSHLKYAATRNNSKPWYVKSTSNMKKRGYYCRTHQEGRDQTWGNEESFEICHLSHR